MQLIHKIVIIAAILLLPAQSASAHTFNGKNGYIAFTKTGGGIFAMRKNGTGVQCLSTRTATEMEWSPDGTHLAFVEPQQDGTTHLKVMNIITGITQNFTRRAGISDSEPVWSPSGTSIAFVRVKHEYPAKLSAIFTVNINGNDLKNISGWSEDTSYRVPSWAPENKRLAYEEIDSNGARILIKNLENGTARELTELSDVSHSPLLEWSQGGKKLLFNDSEGQIYTIWADGTHRTVISDGDSYDASWSPDGTRIAFLEDFSGESVSISEPDGTIRYIPLSLSGYNHVDTPVWSPDGKRLVFVATRASDGEKDLLSITRAHEVQAKKIASDVSGVVAWQALDQ